MLQKRIVCATKKLIEDVEVSLVAILMNDSRLLEEIVQDISAVRNTLPKSFTILSDLSETRLDKDLLTS